MRGVMRLVTARAGLVPSRPWRFDKSPAGGLPRVRIGHAPLDLGRLDEVLRAVEGLVTGGQGGRILLPDVEQVVRAERDEVLRSALATAELSLAGGPEMIRAAGRLGVPALALEPRTGAQWLPPLAALARERAWRVVVVAERPKLSEWAAGALRDRYGLLAVGVAAPDVPADGRGPWVDTLIDRIELTRPDLVWVSMDTPKQELFCQHAASRLHGAVLLGVGSAMESLLDGRGGARARGALRSPWRWLLQRLAFQRVLAHARAT
ncbi:WecB/TagA/CpsF family glycosyltransferase [Cystobacter ferrugineus]|uniref:WecB/TagA/CpsF family glycosyltransferase n=1 Tax=Cystobacter ferrugineus TaxID=83449 RepID=UPI0009FEA057|nr:WecB/TagA/CpsF family glycosyltransferase [Cystobacter ferrugineus]